MTTDRLSGRKTLKVNGFLEEFEKDEIKSRVDIVSLFGSFGVKLSPKGKSFVGRCPWHEDKDPSLSVDRDKGLYHCFGCGEAGDAFALVEKMKGVGFRVALDYLKGQAGRLPAARPPKVVAQKAETTTTAQVKDEHPALTLSTIAEHYHKRFCESPAARAYLEKRGIRSAELMRRFKIGYADGSILSMISNGQKGKLKSLGILTEAGRELFSGSLTFPILDEAGRSVGMYARSIEEKAKCRHLYLPGRHHGVFNRKASSAFGEIILTEGIIDALSLIALGFENVQACYGVNGFTEEHLQILKEDRVKTAIVAFDNDSPGQKASEELAGRLVLEGFSVKRISPEAKDWNEDLLAGVAASAIKAKIAAAALAVPEVRREALDVRRDGSRFQFTIGGVSYRLWGAREIFTTNLRVSMRAECKGECFYDNLDLYSARSRAAYSQNLAALFSLEPRRIEKDLLAILEYLEAERDKRLSAADVAPTPHELTEEEKRLGLEFLKSPELFDRIVSDMDDLGYVGEELNKKLIYIAASSRKLEDPISILILSASASGKSFLVDTVRKLIPPEDVIAVTSLSDQALNYIPDGELLHKFLILGETVHSETIEHQIREMLSGHQLSRMVAVKDEKTGEMATRTLSSQVIVSAIMSSTSHEINPENASRCFLVNADESGEQTARIHALQREKYTLSRYFDRLHTIPRIIARHHAAQRLLRPLLIVNPFAEHLDFPRSLIRMRRDHERFVDLIACVCFLRQYQKEPKRCRDPQTGRELEYVECDIEDYRVAYGIMTGGVMSSTYAEIPRAMAAFYGELRELFRGRARECGLKIGEVGLSQREIRKGIGWVGGESAKKYLRRLVALEYLQRSHGGERGMRNSYQLVADEPMERLDFSMIPSPESIEAVMEGQAGKVGNSS
jgi:DNA primase catalytic core